MEPVYEHAKRDGNDVLILPLRTRPNPKTTSFGATQFVEQKLQHELPEPEESGYVRLSKRNVDVLLEALRYEADLLPPLLRSDELVFEEMQQVVASWDQ